MTAHAAEWAGAERFFVSRDGSPMRGNAVYQALSRLAEAGDAAKLPRKLGS